MLHKITAAFPWIVTLSALLGLVYPPTFTWFQGPLITLGLGGIMLGMGLTLKGADFVQVVRQPKWVFLGLGL
jgi:BASS family bile acid:Na+ symporter